MKALVAGFGILTLLTLVACYVGAIVEWRGTTNLIELLKVMVSWPVVASGAAVMFHEKIGIWLRSLRQGPAGSGPARV